MGGMRCDFPPARKILYKLHLDLMISVYSWTAKLCNRQSKINVCNFLPFRLLALIRIWEATTGCMLHERLCQSNNFLHGSVANHARMRHLWVCGVAHGPSYCKWGLPFPPQALYTRRNGTGCLVAMKFSGPGPPSTLELSPASRFRV